MKASIAKFSLAQLQNALIGFYKELDTIKDTVRFDEVFAAYQMTFDEVAERMGDSFDDWMDANLA